MEFRDNQNLRDARAEYFARAGFATDGGYDDDWVHVDLGPLSIKFPNSDARRRAVRYHDLHHVVTGYNTDMVGEAEISAWEISSSCRDMVAAWILNLLAFGHVLVRKPRRLYTAFLRGRQSQNLYGVPFDEALLDKTVSEIREQLQLDRPVPPTTLSNRAAFLVWSLLAIGLAWGPIVVPVGLFIYWVA